MEQQSSAGSQNADLVASIKESIVQAEPMEVEAVEEENMTVQLGVEVSLISTSGVDDQSACQSEHSQNQSSSLPV